MFDGMSLVSAVLPWEKLWDRSLCSACDLIQNICPEHWR
jgi:hypothetical protein